MRPKITRQMPIGELVMNYPEAVEILFSRGFHCIGCGLSAYETLEQGAAAHGYDEAGIDGLVADIQAAAKKAESMAAERKCEAAPATLRELPGSDAKTKSADLQCKKPDAKKKPKAMKRGKARSREA